MKSSIYIVGASMLLTPALAYSNSKPQQPNVVIFLADDVSFNDLECYGSLNTRTPNLNKLVEEGMKFNKCYQQVAMSSPTRHSLYTGLYPVRSGAIPNHTFVHDDVKSFVQYFGKAGYRTALYGKEHVKPKSVFSYDYLGDYKLGKMNFGAIKNYIAASDDPFFMVVASHEAHHPYNCGNPERWSVEDLVLPPTFVDTPLTRLEYRHYLAEIELMDSQVGQVRKILDDKGITDNTIFIYLSEQGSSFPFSKWTCYGQGLQSAMVVRYPNLIEAGSQSDALVEYVDVLPTVMDLVDVDFQTKEIDGESFADVLKGKKSEHKERVYGIHTNTGVKSGTVLYGIRTVSDKRFRYIKNLLPESRYYNLIQKTPWWGEWVRKAEEGDKFAQQQIHNYEHRPEEELYDIVNDPNEMTNLATNPDYKDVIEDMRKELDTWMTSQGDKGVQTDKDALYRLLPGMRKRYVNNPAFK